MSIRVVHVTTKEELDAVFAVRQEVFVIEQEVDPPEEFDEFEDTSRHFLAYGPDGKPAGCARWRYTDHGAKLERFAVYKPYRGQGVGAALVAQVLKDIDQHGESGGKTRYLHAQLPAIPLYTRFGFQKVGDLFIECDIEHYTMEIPNSAS